MTAPLPFAQDHLCDRLTRLPNARTATTATGSSPRADLGLLRHQHLRRAPDARQAAEGRLRQARRRHPAREEARSRDRAHRRAGHQGMGDQPRRDALHALVPAADRPHGREARRLPHLRRQPPAGGVVHRRAAHPERARCVELPVRRPARHVGSARLHGVEPGEPGVHRRVAAARARCAFRRCSSATTARRSTR